MTVILHDAILANLFEQIINRLVVIGQGINPNGHILELNELPSEELLTNPDGWQAGIILNDIIKFCNDNDLSHMLPEWIKDIK